MMKVQFLDTKTIIGSRERLIKRELDSIIKEHQIIPKIGILLVTGDQIVMAQVDKVQRMAQNVGFEISVDQVAERNVDRSFKDKLTRMSEDDSYIGIWVATPRFDYPPYETITRLLAPGKDLTGCHHFNFGKYMFGKPSLVPPKVRAVHDVLDEYIEGYIEKGAVIISTKTDGTRGFFGKYLAGYLYDLGMKVSIRNVMSSEEKKTGIVEIYNPFGEIVITALNTSNALTGMHLKRGTYIIDTGYNFQRNRLCGDVNINSVEKVCSAITPVPGGIDALIPVEILVNALDVVRQKVGVPKVLPEAKGLRRRGLR